MKLLIVIVNYRTASMVVDCLESLEVEIAAIPGARTVVVDNASGDGSADEIEAAIASRRWEPWVNVVRSSRNGGFAYGNNLAIRPAMVSDDPPEFVHLLNPDTLVRPGAIRVLLDFVDANPAAGIAGSLLEAPNGETHSNGFRFHGIASEFERTVRLRIVSRLLRRWVIPESLTGKNQQVGWVCGASMMIRSEVFERADYFDERYFLYYEEEDFCLQANRAGWSCWYVPESRVIHIISASSGVLVGGKRRPAYWFESRLHYLRKNHGRLYAFVASAVWVLGHALWKLRTAIQRGPSEDPPHLLGDFIRFSFFRPEAVSAGEERVTTTTDSPDRKYVHTRSYSPMLQGKVDNNPKDISFAALIAEDFRTHERNLFDPGFWAVANHRLGNWRMRIPSKLLRAPFTIVYRTVDAFLRLFMGIDLPYVTTLGRRPRIWHHGGIFVGARSIGDDVHLRHNTTIGVLRRGEDDFKPVIGNRVDIGPGVAILGGYEIGDDVVIGANSVIVKNIPSGSTVFGVPARRVNLKLDRPKPEAVGPEPKGEDAAT